jgi:NADPH-dependent glutamate synthase beta subunit-like oxidoreductase
MSRPLQKKFSESKKKVAIVGSGPAGLMAGYELRKMGHGISIFESHSTPGGMFSLAIPEYRVPLQIVQDEIRMLEGFGIELQTNTTIGKDFPIEQLMQDGYDAVLLAVGAHQCKKMEIPGEDYEGVYNSLDFLQELKINKKAIKDKTVAVIGGGNTAMDSASVAIKYGAKEVFLLYRRTREEMPADINEIRETENDGVKIRYLESPLAIHGEKSKVNMLECIKMELGEADMTGRRKPVPVEGSNFSLDTDLVVIAIGEHPGIEPFREEVAYGRSNNILVNPFTMETSIPGIFAAGDSVLGPATVADAILGARKAAFGIDTKLTHHDNG